MTGTGVMKIVFFKIKKSLRMLPVCCLFSSLLNLGLKIDLLILFNSSCRSLLWCSGFFFYILLSSIPEKKGRN